MPSIDIADEDYDFLSQQVELEDLSVEEYVSQMVDRQRVIVKYKDGAPPSSAKNPNFEAPHRKWGM